MSLLFALLRAKVEMDSVGREAEMGAAGGTPLSGDSDTECMVDEAEGCLLWLEEPAERREVLRLLRNCRPSTVLEMLCREKRLCGVRGASYWLLT